MVMKGTYKPKVSHSFKIKLLQRARVIDRLRSIVAAKAKKSETKN